MQSFREVVNDIATNSPRVQNLRRQLEKSPHHSVGATEEDKFVIGLVHFGRNGDAGPQTGSRRQLILFQWLAKYAKSSCWATKGYRWARVFRGWRPVIS
jgi:hypothetical protein